MRETRTAILERIKQHGSVTIAELADEMGLSAVTIRHHLYALMADRLVERHSLRGGVGRPQHGYSLTETGQRQFPSRYHVLSNHLLYAFKATQSPAAVEAVLESVVRQLFALPQDQDNMTPEQRLRMLEQHLQQQDIPIRLSFTDNGSHAALELTCPYSYVSQHHPELCEVDKRVIEDILALPLQRTGCLLDGDKSCTFTIDLQHIREPLETGSY